MDKLCLLFLALWVATVSTFAANQEKQPTQEEAVEEQEGSPPEENPRVIGQTRSMEEYDAWIVIGETPTLEEKTELAEKFLEKFPESGLTPYAHDILARFHLQRGDDDKFFEHAEEALREVPNKADLAILLAVEYAEGGRADEAIGRAQSSLQVLQDLPRSSEMTLADWTMEKHQLQADCHYALGRSYLTKYLQDKSSKSAGKDPNLEQAQKNLEQACVLDPEHDRAYYRLGFLFTKQNIANKAVENYARAVALDGITSDRAKSALEKIHSFIQKYLPDSELGKKNFEELIATEREYIQGQIAERQVKLQELQEEDQLAIPIEALP